MGDCAFQVSVIEQVVLRLYGKALVPRFERRSVGHHLRLKDAIDFKSRIIVEASRRLFWTTKRGYSAGAISAFPLGSIGLREVALLLVEPSLHPPLTNGPPL
jgi:hypothetical protein